MEKQYKDKSGEIYEEQELWDIFMEYVDDGTYEDYSDESFAQYLSDEGFTEI